MEWYMEYGGTYIINGNKVFGRKKYITINDINNQLNNVRSKFNNTDVYLTAYAYNTDNQNESDIIGNFYLDLDIDLCDEDSFSKVKQDTLIAISYLNTILKIPKEFIRIYFSGGKGFHIIVPKVVLGLQPCSDLNDRFKALALEIKKHTINKTIDTGIYDKKRLIRLPHSINGKTGLYKVPLTEGMLRLTNYSTLCEYAKTDKVLGFKEVELIEQAKKELESIYAETVKPKKNNNNRSFVNKDYEIPICIKYIFSNGTTQGNRNNTLIILASALLQKGIEMDECIEMLQDWNEEKVSPRLENNELVNTIKSAYNGLTQGRRYGCSSVKNLGYCMGEHCKIFNR